MSLDKAAWLLAVALMPAVAPGSEWGQNPVWDDGLAEVAHYEAVRPVYGRSRTYEAVFITVKEDFNAAFHTKADPPYQGRKLLPILKLNIVAEVETENYPYRYLTSIFVDRNDVGRLIKMTNGSQEWCGNTFKEVRTWGGRHELAYHSYWDGEGDGTHALDWGADTMLEDQLALSLRALPFAAGHEQALSLVPTQINNRARKPTTLAGRLRVEAEEPVEVPGGEMSCWRVEVVFGDAKQTYWFGVDFPNILARFEATDGRSLRLAKWSRRKYW